MLPSPQILGRREHCQWIRPRISAKESGGDPASPEVSTPQFAKSLFVYFRRIYLYPRREAGRVIFAYVVRIRATSLLKHPCWLCWRESLKIDSSEHG